MLQTPLLALVPWVSLLITVGELTGALEKFACFFPHSHTLGHHISFGCTDFVVPSTHHMISIIKDVKLFVMQVISAVKDDPMVSGDLGVSTTVIANTLLKFLKRKWKLFLQDHFFCGPRHPSSLKSYHLIVFLQLKCKIMIEEDIAFPDHIKHKTHA